MYRELPDIEQWCFECKQVVTCTPVMDMDTGYVEVLCPICGEEECDDVITCTCGEPMGKGDDYCPSCMDDLKDALDRFSNMLPIGMETSKAIEYITDNWIGE